MSEWQPIETAPLNRAILIFERTQHVDFIDVAVWDDDKGFWVDPICICGSCRPTHWMPLPDPPRSET